MAVLNWGLLLSFYVGVGMFLGAYSSIAPMVPRLRELAELRITEGTKVISADGEVLAKLSEENREFVSIDEIPAQLKQAIVAVEDDAFYQHAGIDPKGILRAAWTNILSRKVKQGGSTITQQLARNAYDLRRRTLQRKIQEFLLAIEIERRYTKDEILELYLNEIYFGEHAYGVKVAAKTYFGKAPSELELAECALLAGLPKAPSHYNPFRSPERAMERRNVVLWRMSEVGYISPREAQMTAAQPLELTEERIVRGRRSYRAPYFIAYVLQQANDFFGADVVSRGGLTIHTTLNLGVQQEAEKILTAEVQRAKSRKVSEGALVALDVRTGAIKAMVGGMDFSASEFNRAVQGNRQVGSAFKPFVYTAAIEQGMRPDDTVDDSPVTYPDGQGGQYVPHNYDHTYMGEITLTKALALSRNVCAVKLIAQIGAIPVIRTAERMGIKGPLDPYLSLALGTCSTTPLDMASAFAVFANGGYRLEPYAIAKIEDAAGNVLVEHMPSPVKVMNPSTAATMTKMLAEVVVRGTASGARYRVGGLPFPAAGKTGTTSDHKDAWFVGWAEGMSCAVWVGNDKPIEMARVTGGSIPAPIWMKFMKAAVPIIAQGRTKAFVRATEIDRLAASVEQPAPEPPPGSETDDGEYSEGDFEDESSEARLNRLLRGEDPSLGEISIPPVGNESSGETEIVGICAVTGKRATSYCPRMLLRTFSKGRAPISTCPLHRDPHKERE